MAKKKVKQVKKVAPKSEIIWEGEIRNSKYRIVKSYDQDEVYDPEFPDDDWNPEPYNIIERYGMDAMGKGHWSEMDSDYIALDIIEELVQLIKPKPVKKTTKKKK